MSPLLMLHVPTNYLRITIGRCINDLAGCRKSIRFSEEFCGQPQTHRILALKWAKDGKPKARRLINRILLFIPSTKPLVMR